jgi:hypothetical protein
MFEPLRTVVMPERFFSSETGRPFERCIRCGRPLFRDGAPYLIEKAVRRVPEYDATEVIFEYAMCVGCYEALWKLFSGESLRNIDAYFAARVDFEGRARTLAGTPPDVDHWLAHCVVKGTPAAEMTEYQIAGLCVGDRLMLSHLPCLIGMEAMDELSACLSAATKDELDGFADEFLGIPPELRSLFKDTNVFLL